MGSGKREPGTLGPSALAAAISAAVAGSSGAAFGPGCRRARRDHRHRHPARRADPGRPRVHQRHRQRRHRQARPAADGRLRQVRARPVDGREGAGRHHHRLPRRGVLRHPVRLGVVRRALSRRAAHHGQRTQSRPAAHRHRARRGPARAAGHAVWRQLPVGHAARHHQQAGSGRVRRLGGRAGFATSTAGTWATTSAACSISRWSATSWPCAWWASPREDAGFIDNVLSSSQGGTFDNADTGRRQRQLGADHRRPGRAALGHHATT